MKPNDKTKIETIELTATDSYPKWAKVKNYKLDQNKCAFMYLSINEEQSEKLIRSISTSEMYSIIPIDIFKKDNQQNGAKLSDFAAKFPGLYRKLLIDHLKPLQKKIRGVIFTTELNHVMRILSSVCEELGIERYLILNESPLADLDSFYCDPVIGSSLPMAENILCWGSLQADLLIARGAKKTNFNILGNPAFDTYIDFKPSVSKDELFSRYGIDTNRKVIVFAMQSFSSAPNRKKPLKRQMSALTDTVMQCKKKRSQLIVLGDNDTVKLVEPNDNITAVINEDDAPCSAADIIFHTDGMVSISSEKLFDAYLLKRPGVAVQYFGTNNIWNKLGIKVVSQKYTLLSSIDNMLENGFKNSEEADMLASKIMSVGYFDKCSADRVSIFFDRESYRIPQPVKTEIHTFTSQNIDVAGAVNFSPDDIRFEQFSKMLKINKLTKPNGTFDALICNLLFQFEKPDEAQNDVIKETGKTPLVFDKGLLQSPDKQLFSIILGGESSYYDARTESMIEMHLNSKAKTDKNKISLAESAIRNIKKLKITKNPGYVYSEDDTGFGDNIVVVIDQDKSDPRIEASFASAATFEQMLDEAVRDNPDTDIVIFKDGKSDNTHITQDVISKYNVNISIADSSLHPHKLFGISKKTYTVSSDLGMEALLYNNDVHCFGVTFYSNWGETKDKLQAERRTRSRNITDIFFAAYIRFSRYCAPGMENSCNINKAIKYINEYSRG